MSQIKFGTDGWRAIIADQFTFHHVRLVVTAIARYIQRTYPADRPVLIGYDTRFLADEFAQLAAEVLVCHERMVLMSDRDVPTPCIALAARDWNSAGALMFTASHNPPYYLGIKYIPDYAGPATAAITDQITANLRQVEQEDLPALKKELCGNIERFDPAPAFLQALKDRLDLEKLSTFSAKIAYDALYSTGRGFLDELLAEVTESEIHLLHDWRDPLFGGGMPEPAPSQLGELIGYVQEEHCVVGLATDGDSDRFGVVDERGKYYSPNQVIALLARHLVRNRGCQGAIVRTVATTHLLDRMAEKYGVDLLETPVGFKHVGEAMRQRVVLIGGEESGGLSIVGHIPEKDGILANALVVEMLAYEQKPLSEIWEDLVAEVGFEPFNCRLDLHLSDGAKAAVMDLFRSRPPAEIAGQKVTRTDQKDGVKCYLESGEWILVRPSGTEPLIRVYLEAHSEAGLDSLRNAVETLIGQPA